MNRYKLAKSTVTAMFAAGLSAKQVHNVELKLAKKKVVQISASMVKRISTVIAEHGTAIVTSKTVFSPAGWKARMAGSVHLHAARAARAAKTAPPTDAEIASV